MRLGRFTILLRVRIDFNLKLFLSLLFWQATLEAYKQSSPDDSEAKIKFQKAFTSILDDVQSVIDSPHTRKEKREKIVALCENAQDIMKDILEKHKNNKVTDLLAMVHVAFSKVGL